MAASCLRSIDLSAFARKFPSIARKSYDGYIPDMSYECDVLSIIRRQTKNNHFKVLLSVPGEVIAYKHKKKTSWIVCESKVRLMRGVYGTKFTLPMNIMRPFLLFKIGDLVWQSAD